MRLRRLRLTNYGPFANVDLPFACERGCVSVLVAPNSAGKSVLRRAFHDLLFDIPTQSPMRFRHGNSGVAVHAEAVGHDGVAFDFGWLRGGKPQRTTSDPARFEALRREVTPKQLENLFALDTAGLREGGTDLKGSSTLGGALLAGTGELASVRKIGAEIDRRKDGIWNRRKSLPPLNKSGAALDKARKSARDAVQRPEQREREEGALAACRTELADAKRAYDDALAVTKKLARIDRTRPHLTALREAEAWFAANPHAPALPNGLAEQLAQARRLVATSQATIVPCRDALEKAEHELASIGLDKAAQEASAEVALLAGELGAHEKAGGDVKRLRADRETQLGVVRAILGEIGTDVAAENAGALIVSIVDERAVTRAIRDEEVFRTKLDDAAAKQAKADREIAELAEEAIASAAVLPDGLETLLREIRADRNPTQHAAEATRAVRDADAALRAALALVPRWQGSAEQLRALALSADGVLERLDTAHRQAADRERAAHAAEQRQIDQHVALMAQLASLREQPLPDAAAIADARRVRDQGMRLVLRRAFSPEPDHDGERAYAGEEPLPLRYERQVREADDLADRRVDEVTRVETAERLNREIAALATQIAATTAERDAAVTNLAEAHTSWADACAPIGATDATLSEMRATLAARGKVVEALRVHEIALGEDAAVANRHAAWAERLARTLGDVPAEPLPALLAKADELVAAVSKAAAAATERDTKQARARSDRQAAEGERDDATRQLHEWSGAWTKLIARIGRPADEPSQTTAAILDRLKALSKPHQETVGLAKRIADMDSDHAAFGVRVGTLARSIGEPEGIAPFETARALIARANAAANRQSAWDQAEAHVASAREAANTAERAAEDAGRELRGVIAAAGATTAEEAETRIAAAREHARHTVIRDVALKGLGEQGEGLSRPALEAEIDEVAPDRMPMLRHMAETAVSEANATVQRALLHESELSKSFAAEGDRTDAIDTQVALEAAVTEFSRRLDDYLVLRVASGLLGQAMAAVDARSGETALRRLDKTLSAVTGGAHGITERDTEKGPALFVVEHAFADEEKTLDQLSEGTRDQLYLALRIVALQDHCRAASPLPFIADDVLQTFDDRRARSALEALVGLSHDTQVIVLTHHEHVATIAATLPNGAAHVFRL